MSRLRSRLTALTCAAAAVLSGLRASPAPRPEAPHLPPAGARPPPLPRPGSSCSSPTPSPAASAIATFDTVPTAEQVDALVEPRARRPADEAAAAGHRRWHGCRAQRRGRCRCGPRRLPERDAVVRRHRLVGRHVDHAQGRCRTAREGSHRQGRDRRHRRLRLRRDPSRPHGPDRPQRHACERRVRQPGSERAEHPRRTGRPVPATSNSDIGSGHGTHVAGIVAADGTSGSKFLGVAPDAKLACFGIGAVITTTAVVTAYDYMLRQPEHAGHRRHQQLVGQHLPPVRPEGPGQRRDQGGHGQGCRRRVLGRQLGLRERRVDASARSTRHRG